MRIATDIAMAVALAGFALPSGAQPAEGPMREVKVSVAASAIDSFVPCLAHGLDHFRADFEHVIAPLGDGGFEMRSFGPDKALLMVNRLRRVDREVTVATRVHADAPPLEKWYAGVDEGIDECKQ